MKKFFVMICLLTVVFLISSFQAGKMDGLNSVSGDSLEADRAKYIALVNEHIKGKEQLPVDSVFKNLRVLGGFPAENLVFAMNIWSRALGVSCGHCHNTNDFSTDEKEKKDIAREMVIMGNVINEKLSTINGLSTRPIVNCVTCHRGDLKPALRIPVNK